MKKYVLTQEIKIAGAITILAGVLLCWGLFLPYVKAWEVGILELFAKHHLLYGLKISRGLPIMDMLGGRPNYYILHPPLVPLLLALSFKFFGIHEWSARLIPIVFSLSGLIFFFLLVKGIADRKTALLSMFFMSLMPMFNYYGRIVNYEAITLGLSIVFLYLFVQFIHTGKLFFALMLAFISVLGVLSDWPFVLFLLSPALYIRYKKKGAAAYAGLMLLAVLTIVGIFLFFIKTVPFSLNRQLSGFFYHCQHRSLLLHIGFYRTLIKNVILNFTPCGVLCLALWIHMVRKKKIRMTDEVNLVARMLLLFGAALPLMTPHAAYIHVWTLQYLTPAMALIAALVVGRLKKQWQIILTASFVLFGLGYFAKLHIFRFPGPYQAGMQIAKMASPKDILYTNTVSPVSFYSGIETLVFSNKEPDIFVKRELPRFVCIVKYTDKDKFDYEKMQETLLQRQYKNKYNEHKVVLWVCEEDI
ncbi:MAG: glycosyltransferase family 39 protein [Candidatus Omnitrophica bacterium]|nr:glycosyltransferase family 39 protein [Candidatus Omnitrophota bacterium]